MRESYYTLWLDRERDIKLTGYNISEEEAVELSQEAHRLWSDAVGKAIESNANFYLGEKKMPTEKSVGMTDDELNAKTDELLRMPMPQMGNAVKQLLILEGKYHVLRAEKAAAEVGPPKPEEFNPRTPGGRWRGDKSEHFIEPTMSKPDAVERELKERIEALEVWREGVNRDISRLGQVLAQNRQHHDAQEQRITQLFTAVDAINAADIDNTQKVMDRLSRLEGPKCLACGAYPR